MKSCQMHVSSPWVIDESTHRTCGREGHPWPNIGLDPDRYNLSIVYLCWQHRRAIEETLAEMVEKGAPRSGGDRPHDLVAAVLSGEEERVNNQREKARQEELQVAREVASRLSAKQYQPKAVSS